MSIRLTAHQATTRLIRAFLGGLQPPPELTVSQWADEYRFLSPEASAEPGKWNTERAPYQRGIMDAITDPNVSRVVCIKGAQVGWTEVINNVCGYYIHQDPAPLLVIQPTEAMAATWSKDRLTPMLRDTPVIRNRVREAKSRDSGNTIQQKVFDGGRITIIGANAPSQLASRPIRIVLADEVDRYPLNAGREGDPLALAAKRQTTFWNRKTLIGSTPTLKGVSVIEREWLQSDQRRYFVTCADCGHAQHLRWPQVVWDKGEGGEHRPETARYVCEECGVPWDDGERVAALQGGEWRATRPGGAVAGFHIPGLLSPWLTIAEIVDEFLKARNDPALLQVWVNTVLGETWEETGETVSDEVLLTRRESYAPDLLPEQVLALAAGVDVQDDRLELQVIGFGSLEESWAVRYEIIRGDPASPEVWDALDELLLEQYRTEGGRALRVKATCIDTGGHYAAQVYSFVAKRKKRRIFATKGMGGPRPIWPKRASKAKNNNLVYGIGVDTAKDLLYARLRIDKAGPGYCHFPTSQDFDAAYFGQLTSETVITKTKNGRAYRAWMLKKGRRNEALDTFVLALAAIRSTNIRLDYRDVEPPPPPRLEPPVVDAITPDGDVGAPPVHEQQRRVIARKRMERRVFHSNWMGR